MRDALTHEGREQGRVQGLRYGLAGEGVVPGAVVQVQRQTDGE